MMVDGGKIPHALMLHGAPGSGKTMLARALIQYINCTDRRDGDSCGVCTACKTTARLNNPDVRYVYPIVKKGLEKPVSTDYFTEWTEMLRDHPYMSTESWMEILGAGNSQPAIYIYECDEIIRISNLSAYGNGYKIFMVWLPEKMNIEASNRLLKIIEEPYDDTLFIFVSNNPENLLPTISSRLQQIAVSDLPDEEIIKYFVSKEKPYEEALALAKIAGGNMNLAISLADENSETEEFSSLFMDLMRNCYARNLTALRSQAEKLAAGGREKSMRFLTYFSRMLRESFISNLKISALSSMTPKESAFTVKFGPFINEGNVEAMMQAADSAYTDISRNGNQKIIWFDFFLIIMEKLRGGGRR